MQFSKSKLTVHTFALIQLFICCCCKPHLDTVSRQDAEHFMNDPENHDTTFDHNAFLGEEQAKTFSRLSANESEQRLRNILKRIDTDSDKLINEEELKTWIKHVADDSVRSSTLKQWNEANINNQDSISWKEYAERIYGPAEERLNDKSTAESYKEAIRHDIRRWKAADLDEDENLTLKEFTDFVHPEDKDHMRDVIIDELMESVDMDKDGFVSEDEYIQDLAKAYQTPIKPGEPEPDWLKREREQFHQYRDANKDGRMDRFEIGEWIMPKNYDPIEAETKHLIYHSDENNDGKLSEEEIVKNRKLFVSSQATNYGNVLDKHEEL